jgi:hypothetical protein
VVEFARQDAVATSVSRQKNHVTPGQFAGEQIVRRRPEGRFDLDPFLMGEALEIVKAGAADDADAMFRHARIVNRWTREIHKKSNGTSHPENREAVDQRRGPLRRDDLRENFTFPCWPLGKDWLI